MCFGGRTVKGKKVSACRYTLVLHRKYSVKEVFRPYRSQNWLNVQFSL